MIEKTLIKNLSSLLNVPVYAEVPEEPSVPYIVIQKTGGHVTDCIVYGTVAVQTYAETKLDAAELAETVKAALTDCSFFSACKVNAGPYDYTDTTKHIYRYQTVYEITE